ncbi:hypothetical protein L596_024564 [Steinernema carpocapsae]|uniref:BTB domain-containing protein n=1 Tax=Steinernema carpocapsae TaxID=34508 RepID=A0A4U5MH59_STECR|nr:hypothetical protein L596_024564 [Steinernema carpocapsae]
MAGSGPNRVSLPTYSVAAVRPMSPSRAYLNVPSNRFYHDHQASPRASNSSISVNRHSSQRFEVISKQATKVTAISTRLEWRIEQFEKLMKLYRNGHNLVSQQFSCTHASSVVWELHVYPNGKREEDAGHVSFFLRQVGLQRGEEPIMTEFQIYTNDKDGNRVSVCRDTKDFTNQQGRGKFQVQREKLLGALKTDLSLLLICEVEYFPPGTKISVQQADECEDLDDTEDRHEFSLRTAMKDMFDSERLADCIIKVEQKEFRVHRCILAQQSEVFRSMFSQSSMVEAQKGVINITDSHPEPVKAMLEFIYTGTTNLSLPTESPVITPRSSTLKTCLRSPTSTPSCRSKNSASASWLTRLTRSRLLRLSFSPTRTLPRSCEWRARASSWQISATSFEARNGSN